MATVITKELVAVLRSQFRIRWDGIHGVQHWSRVRLYCLCFLVDDRTFCFA
jgi:hypothetical protein